MSTIIDEFLKDEDVALLEKRQGVYYPDNHHRIKPEFKKVFKKLDPQTLQKYYFHSLRIGNFPFDVSAETWGSLIKAVEQIVFPYLEAPQENVNCRLTRFESLFLFGIDGMMLIAVDPSFDLTVFNERLAVYKKAQQYVHLPGMLEKLSKLTVFTENERLLKHIHFTLRLSGFNHESRSAVNFLFWTMMAVIMLKDDDATKETLELFKMANLPDKQNRLQIFDRFETAIKKLN